MQQAQCSQQEPTFRDFSVLNQGLKCETKGFFLQRHFQDLPPHEQPLHPLEQLNCSDRSKWSKPTVSPKASPGYGADRKGPSWPAAEKQAVEQVSFVLQYYANKQIKLST